jgi:hypothetical protein
VLIVQISFNFCWSIHQGLWSFNFIGGAGADATNAFNSNFFGPKVGTRATNANNSNFFGLKAGNVATNADNSNFFGQILVAQQMHMGQIS